MKPTTTIYPGPTHGQLKSKFHEKTKSDEVSICTLLNDQLGNG